MKKKIVGYVILAAFAILLAACGKNDDGDKQGSASENASEEDYSYIPEYKKMGGGKYTSFQDIRFAGDCLYYSQVFFDVVNQKNEPVLKQYSLTEEKILRERDMIADLGDNRRRQVGKYYVLENGNMYTVESVYAHSDNSRTTLLCSYDAEWNLMWEQDITSVLDQVDKYSQADYITSDAEGQICLAVENTLCLFDAAGMHLGNIVPENGWIDGLCADREGRAYVCYQAQQSMGQREYCLAEIDFENGKLGSIYRNFSAEGRFAAGQEDDLLISSESRLLRYNFGAESVEELLDWSACGINGNYVEAVGAGADGELMVFLQDFSVGESFLVSLKRVETATLPEKTQITIGCLGDSSELQSKAAAFNRQSDSCYVTLINYAREKDGTASDPQDFVNSLSMALATGIDCPDILVLDQMEAYQMDVENMAGNDAFVDLEPFLESSSLLKQEDYLENALDCYRYHGQLVGIPREIILRTIAGSAADLGKECGWTLEKMLAYADAHPEQQLFGNAVREDILHDCLIFGLDTFIDWETGQCCFQSEEFERLLTFAGTFPSEYADQADVRTTQKMVQEGDVLLYKTMINDFYGIQEHQVMFGGPVAYIGYPAADGIGCIVESSGALALSAQSRNPEAAWSFIEYYLEISSDDSKWRAGFSTRKSVLDQQMEEAVTVSYYLDEEGNPLLDAAGNPVPQSLGGVRWSFEDEEITFRTATDEEVHCVKEMIVSARPASTAGDRIMDIIREEAEPFFQGQKSVEEAADIIQSRVQIYLDER